jgi:hypothetical protein
VVGSERPPDFPGDVLEVVGRTLRYIEGSILDREVYQRAAVASAHAVILGSLQAEDYKDADARMLTSLLMVQDVVNTSGSSSTGKPPHIVACIQYPGARWRRWGAVAGQCRAVQWVEAGCLRVLWLPLRRACRPAC